MPETSIVIKATDRFSDAMKTMSSSAKAKAQLVKKRKNEAASQSESGQTYLGKQDYERESRNSKDHRHPKVKHQHRVIFQERPNFFHV